MMNSSTTEKDMLSTIMKEKPEQEKNKYDSSKPCSIETELKKTSTTYDNLVVEIRDKMEKGYGSSELSVFASSLLGSIPELVAALVEAVLGGKKKAFAKEVEKKLDYLHYAVENVGTETILLHAVEAFCGKFGGDALQDVGSAVKALYEGNVIKEESIVQWYRDGVAGPNKNLEVWKNMEPFLEWFLAECWCCDELSGLLEQARRKRSMH